MKLNQVLALSLVLASTSALAQNTGTTRQALGEQCSVITNVVEASDGCGGGAGDIQIDFSTSVEGGKEYSVEVQVVNDRDVVESAFFDDGVYFSRDDIYRQSAIVWSYPSAGRYQVNLFVRNAVTGTTVCTATQTVTTAN